LGFKRIDLPLINSLFSKNPQVIYLIDSLRNLLSAYLVDKFVIFLSAIEPKTLCILLYYSPFLDNFFTNLS